MTHTFIPGKDAALEDSISHFQQKLTALGINIEEASWLNPVPNVWSVHIRDKDCPACFTNGKGASKKAALASALGEFFERLSNNYFFADFYLGEDVANSDFVHYPNEKWFEISDDADMPQGIMNDELWAYYDPESALTPYDLIDLQSGNVQRGICCLPFVRQSDNCTTYIPMNIIGNLYVSNGMSAGNNHHEAHVQAMSEIFERHIKNRIISEAISLPRIPQSAIDRYPETKAAIETLEAEGFPIFAYDASLGGEYPVICVVLFSPETNGCFASFGAHPNFEVALERTVTELLQGRSLKELDVFAAPSFANDEVAEQTNLETHFIDSSGLISWDLFKDESDYPFVDWDFSGDTATEFNRLMAIFEKEQREVYIADYDHLGVAACRILVPGYSEIYSPEDLFMANNNMAMDLRETIFDLPNADWDEDTYLNFIEQLEDEGLDDLTRVRELLGIAVSNDSPWHQLRIGELKAMLSLAAGDLEQAQDWVQWTIEFNASNFTPSRLNYYRCVAQLIELAMDETRDPAQYESAFAKMFGREVLDAALAAVNGEAPFYDLTAIEFDLSNLPAHQNLLDCYQKLHSAKASNTFSDK